MSGEEADVPVAHPDHDPLGDRFAGQALACGSMSTTEDRHLPLFIEHVVGAYAVLLLGLGRRTGLLQGLLEGAGTANEIAARANVDTRNALEWLSGMAAAGYAEHQSGTFRAAETTSMTFGPQFPVDAGAVVDGFMSIPQAYDSLVGAIRGGGGLSVEQLAPYGPFVGVNTPTYEMALVDEWIGGLPGLREKLDAGASVAELAPGNGAAAAVLGRAFPASTFIGFDIHPRPLPDLPGNVRIEPGDARKVPADGFDLVYVFDSLHHMNDPDAVLASVRRALTPNGVVLVAENDFTGNLDEDVANPFSTIAYTSSLMYCLQEALHGPGDAHTCAEGVAWLVDGLATAGFHDVQVRHSPTGYALVSGVA